MTRLSVNINKVATLRNARGGTVPNVVQFAVKTEFNIEGYPDDRFMKMMEQIRPDQVTLVPDQPGVLTSNAGWDTRKHASFLREILDQLKSLGLRTSLFCEPDFDRIEGAKVIGADRIELYTGPYAEYYSLGKENAVKPYVQAAQYAMDCGLGVNAGHDLSLDNLAYFKQSLPQLDEVSIGHALISDALYLGLENTIQRYTHLLV
jgi:pyridoxine 5-phosphate synthase